jgi:polyferredoxin
MKFQIKRLISQISFLFAANLGSLGIKSGLCYPFFYCQACPAADAACPLRALEIGVFRGDINVRLLLYPLLIIGAVGVISGRSVCAWACPIGFLQRGTSPVARKIKNFSSIRKLGSHKIVPYLKHLKYINLIALVILTPLFIGFMFTDVCPVGFFTGTIPISILNPGTYIPSSFFYPALLIFILFIILIFTVERGWCRYFCPVGALLAPFNKISMIYVSVDENKCVHDNACIRVCPMGIDVPNMNRDPECILCGKCIKACPKCAISYKKEIKLK